MQSVKVGEASISVESKGCTVCGTEWASGWAVARSVPVTIGNRRLTVEVSICAECQVKAMPLLKEKGS